MSSKRRGPAVREHAQTVAQSVIDEWVNVTFAGSTPLAMATVGHMLGSSYKAYENYTANLGWTCFCAKNGHYNVDMKGRVGWHNASATHIGYSRVRDQQGTAGGFAHTYSPAVAAQFGDVDLCPEEMLLTFHNVPYSHVLKGARYRSMTVIEWIYSAHASGVRTALQYVDNWRALKDELDWAAYEGVDGSSFDDVTARLALMTHNVSQMKLLNISKALLA